jgi:2,5-diketo-D-gluconate reductase A
MKQASARRSRRPAYRGAISSSRRRVWNDDQGYDNTLRAFDRSRHRLGMDYVDLYLIHWPVPAKDAYIDTWRALEKLYADGLARAIGVSNFQPWHLRRLLDASTVAPAVNQVELHPELQQTEVRAFNRDHGIVTEAWSPLARGAVLRSPVIAALADRYAKSPAQIILRWHIQLGNVVIPKSVTPARIRENIDVFDFELSEDDMASVATLDTGNRIGPDPDGPDNRPRPGFSSAGGRWVPDASG